MSRQLSIDEASTIVITEFWEVIYSNLLDIPTERKASIYQYAKRIAIKKAREAERAELKDSNQRIGRPKKA